MPEIRKTALTDKYRRREVVAKPEINKYYMVISKRYMRAKFITIILLVVFFAFMLLNFDKKSPPCLKEGGPL